MVKQSENLKKSQKISKNHFFSRGVKQTNSGRQTAAAHCINIPGKGGGGRGIGRIEPFEVTGLGSIRRNDPVYMCYQAVGNESPANISHAHFQSGRDRLSDFICLVSFPFFG